MTIRYRHGDGSVRKFEDRDELYAFLESCDSQTARELRWFGVEFYYDPMPHGELLALIGDGQFEGVTQRDLLDMGLDALVEDMHNGREPDDWLFGRLLMDKEAD